MNYDQIAVMKVKELRKEIAVLLPQYNYLTGDRITARELITMPKARLLYMFCRYEAEVDTKHRYKKMVEELQHRANLLTQQQQRKELKRKFYVVVEEVEDNE